MRMWCLIILLTVNSQVFAQDLAHCASDTQADIIGVATELGDSPFTYCEYHFIDSSNNKTKVEYRDEQGALLATKQVDYSQSQVAPDIVQKDERFGELRRSQKKADTFELEYRKSTDAKSTIKTATVKNNAIADAGFDKLIRQQWSTLVDGEKSTFEFVSPLHGKAITLQVILSSKAGQCGKVDYDSATQTCFIIKVNNPLIRMFADSLYLIYNNAEKRLSSYIGTVNILDEQAKSMDAVIRYYYF